MSRFKKIPLKREEKIIYGDGIVDSIVIHAVSEIPYVALNTKTSSGSNTNSSVKVAVNKDGVNVDVCVKIHYSQSVSDMAFRIQENIRHNVETMTEYHILSVNVYVKGLLYDEVKDIKPIKEKETKTVKEQTELNISDKA